MEELNFEEMRNQIAILKTKLDNQDIVNDRMMRNVISSKTNNMKRPIIVSILCALFVIIVAPISFRESLGTSWYFIIGTDVMMLYCILRESLFKRQLRDSDLMNSSLLEVAKRMAEFKKSYKRYTLSNMCLLLPAWIAWLIAETWINKTGKEAIFFTVAMGIGLLIGACIGLWMYFNIQREATDIIKQIEE